MKSSRDATDWSEGLEYLRTYMGGVSLSIAMESRTITKMPYKENKSLIVIVCFMSRSRSALEFPMI